MRLSCVNFIHFSFPSLTTCILKVLYKNLALHVFEKIIFASFINLFNDCFWKFNKKEKNVHLKFLKYCFSDFWLPWYMLDSGYRRHLRMHTRTWVTHWRRCRTSRGLYSATRGQFRSTPPLPTLTATWLPYTRWENCLGQLSHLSVAELLRWPKFWRINGSDIQSGR